MRISIWAFFLQNLLETKGIVSKLNKIMSIEYFNSFFGSNVCLMGNILECVDKKVQD